MVLQSYGGLGQATWDFTPLTDELLNAGCPRNGVASGKVAATKPEADSWPWPLSWLHSAHWKVGRDSSCSHRMLKSNAYKQWPASIHNHFLVYVILSQQMANDYMIRSLVIKILRTNKNTNMGCDISVWWYQVWNSHWQKKVYEQKAHMSIISKCGNSNSIGKWKRGYFQVHSTQKNNHIWLNRGKEITIVA